MTEISERNCSMNDALANKGQISLRSSARLAAVQALYQMDVAQTDLSDVIAEFSDDRLREDREGNTLALEDFEFFKDLLEGVVNSQRTIDPMLNEQLADGWQLTRIDTILRAILRSAVYELLQRSDVPAKVVISEYIDVAHAFFEGEEPKVVNGVLDYIARQLREGEMIPRR